MKVFKRLLLGAVGLLLVGTVCWWLNERRYSPDERLFRALQRDLRFCFALSDLSSFVPGRWARSQLNSGSQFFLTGLGEKLAQLETSGYYTNYRFVITNFPASATNSDLKFIELSRRMDANPRIHQMNEFHAFAGPNDDGKIDLTCRAERLPEFVQTMTQP